jgi:predicted GIY-YIG superfamily endonuclease
MAWHVYLVRCGDGTLYAGATSDLTRRLAAHANGKGARYTRGRGPLVLAWSEEVADRSAALRREHQIKRLRRAEKLRLTSQRVPARKAGR